MNLALSSRSLRWLLPAAILAMLLLSVTGCDWLEELAATTVKEEMGLDINNPVEIAGAAAAGSVFGSQEQNDALAVLRGYRRAQHEQKGDKYSNQGDQSRARDEYKQALQWTDTGSRVGKARAADLHGQISTTYAFEAGNLGETASKVNDPASKANLEEAARERRRLSAFESGKAAELQDDPLKKASWYTTQAAELERAGDTAGACDAFRQAEMADPARIGLGFRYCR